MSELKKYFRVKDIMEAAVKRAQKDPLYQEAEKTCCLDYHLLCHPNRLDEVKLSSFNVIGYTDYGGSEGIYGTIQFLGEWVPQHRESPMLGRMNVYTLKTLREDKKAYLSMGVLVNLICYYANQFIAEHLYAFD